MSYLLPSKILLRSLERLKDYTGAIEKMSKGQRITLVQQLCDPINICITPVDREKKLPMKTESWKLN